MSHAGNFQPGQSGNPGGKPKQKPFKDALLMEAKLAEAGEPSPAPKGSLRWNARKLLEQGDVSAIREIADRLDGKVPQGVIGGEPDDPAIAANVAVSVSDTARFLAGAIGSTDGSASR
jgi:hypothetical protein